MHFFLKPKNKAVPFHNNEQIYLEEPRYWKADYFCPHDKKIREDLVIFFSGRSFGWCVAKFSIIIIIKKWLLILLLLYLVA